MRHLYILLILIVISHFTIAQIGTGWNWAAISGLATNGPGRKTLDIASDANGNTVATRTILGHHDHWRLQYQHIGRWHIGRKL